MVEQGCIAPMCTMLGSQDTLVIQVILDGLGNILKMAGPQVKLVVEMIEEAGGVEKIESLQQHQNIEIYKIAYNLVERYFSSEVSRLFGFDCYYMYVPGGCIVLAWCVALCVA